MSPPPLTLRTIAATPVLVPMRRTLGTSVMQVKQAPLLLIDLQTEEGVTGRAYLFCYLDAAGPAAAALVRDCSAFLAGKSAAPDAVRAALETRFKLIGLRGITAMVAAGIDMACWDALAIAAGLPLARLLGGELRPTPAYNSNGLGLVAPEAAAEEALETGGRGLPRDQDEAGAPARRGRPGGSARGAQGHSRRCAPDVRLQPGAQRRAGTRALPPAGRRGPVLDRRAAAARRLRRQRGPGRAAGDAGADRRELRWPARDGAIARRSTPATT